MCDDLAAVKIAEDMGAVIETACCRGPDPAGEIVTCPHYHTCAYQAQKARTPDVWIFAHQMLFRKNKTLDGISALFIDESFRDAGTTKPVKGLTIDEIEAAPPNAGELAVYREILAAEAAARGRCAALQHPLQPEHRGVHQSDPARVEGEGEARAVAGDAREGSSGCSRGRHQHQTHPHVRPGVARRARIGSARGRRRLRPAVYRQPQDRERDRARRADAGHPRGRKAVQRADAHHGCDAAGKVDPREMVSRSRDRRSDRGPYASRSRASDTRKPDHEEEARRRGAQPPRGATIHTAEARRDRARDRPGHRAEGHRGGAAGDRPAADDRGRALQRDRGARPVQRGAAPDHRGANAARAGRSRS